MSSTSTNHSHFDLRVSDDQLVVTLSVHEGASVTAAEVIAVLREREVKSFDDGVVIAALDKRALEPLTLEIARGTPAVDERAGKVEFRVPVGQGEGVTITRVEAGQVIGKISPNIAGRPGRDVFGKPVEPKPATQLQMGRGVTSVSGEIAATERGNIGIRGAMLSVEPLFEVPPTHRGPIEFDGDLMVKGGLENGRIVRSSGSLLVGGTVEAADIQIGGALQVKGGMISRAKGQCKTGGDLWCRFISGGTLHVQGSVHVQGDVTNAHIVAFKAVNIPRGHVYGGDIVASGGLTCRTLGNDTGTPTNVIVGAEAALDVIAATTSAEIEADKIRVKQIREKIGPLMQQLKHLTHQQREKATELLAQASEVEAEAEQKARELSTRLEQLRANESATVTVSEAVHVGVKIRIRGLETVFVAAFKGPLTITAVKVGRVTQLVMTDTTSNTQTPLPTYAVVENAGPRKAATRAA